MHYADDINDFYLFITFLVAACFAALIGLVLWTVLLIPWFLYWLILATITDGWKLLWSNGIGRFFSK